MSQNNKGVPLSQTCAGTLPVRHDTTHKPMSSIKHEGAEVRTHACKTRRSCCCWAMGMLPSQAHGQSGQPGCLCSWRARASWRRCSSPGSGRAMASSAPAGPSQPITTAGQSAMDEHASHKKRATKACHKTRLPWQSMHDAKSVPQKAYHKTGLRAPAECVAVGGWWLQALCIGILLKDHTQ
eukprot:scaffold137464_cov19-Tisochrysis_lutea.AAC.2